MKKKKDKNQNRALHWLFGKTKGYRAKIVILMLMSVISAALTVAFTLLCKRVIDEVAYNNTSRFLMSGFFILCVLIAATLLDFVAGMISQKMKQKMVVEMRDEMLFHIFRSDYATVSGYHSGDLINRILSDIQIAAQGCADFIPSLTFTAVKFIFASVVLAVIAGKFILIFILACFTISLIMMLAKGKIQNFHKGIQERYAANQSFLQETLSCLLTVKAFRAEKRLKEEYRRRQDDFMDFRLKRWVFHSSAKALLHLCVSTAYLGAVIFGCWGISHQIFTFGSFIAILQLVAEVQSPFSAIPSVLSEYFSVLASVDRILEIQDIPDEKYAVSDREEIYSRADGLEVRDVHFSYGENEVLKGASVYFGKGETVAVSGESGCGKSTLFLLLLGAYEPSQGSIFFTFKDKKGNISPIDGQEKIGCFRNLFSYVPQGNNMFMGTVRDNITLFDGSVSDEECERALKTACAYDFVHEMPDGIYTELKEKGAGLSAGQLQRLTIARAILSGAPILLLDEATCSLDEETEKKVLENIRNLKNKTVLIVAHGREALKICDRVCTLKNGIIS